MDDRRPKAINERRNWKLIYDPVIKKGIQKLYRFDGTVSNSGATSFNVRHLSDPRLISGRTRGKVEPIDLGIPSFKVDENYIGKPPSTEVSFFDLNDNVSQLFLEDICKKCGDIEEVRIFHHSKTKVHLGLGRVVFHKIKAAAYCVEKYNNAPIMGKPVRAVLDPLGKLVKKLAKDYSTKEEAVPSKFFSSTPEPCPPSNSQVNANSDAPTTPSSVTGIPEDPMNNPPLQSALISAINVSLASLDAGTVEMDLIPPPPPPPPPPPASETFTQWNSTEQASPGDDLSLIAYNDTRSDFEATLFTDVMQRFFDTLGLGLLNQWCASQECTASYRAGQPPIGNYQRGSALPFRNVPFNPYKPNNGPIGQWQNRTMATTAPNYGPGMNSIFGTGFRASLQNLPSFKRKPCGPVTPPLKENKELPIDSKSVADESISIQKRVPRSPSATPPPTPSISEESSSSEEEDDRSCSRSSGTDLQDENDIEGNEFSKPSPCPSDRLSSDDECEAGSDVSCDNVAFRPSKRKKLRISTPANTRLSPITQRKETVRHSTGVKHQRPPSSLEADDRERRLTPVSSEDEGSDSSTNNTKVPVSKNTPQKTSKDFELAKISCESSMQMNGEYTKEVLNDVQNKKRDDKISTTLIKPSSAHSTLNSTTQLLEIMKIDNSRPYRPDYYDHCYFLITEPVSQPFLSLERIDSIKSPLKTNKICCENESPLKKNNLHGVEVRNHQKRLDESEKKLRIKEILQKFIQYPPKDQKPRPPLVTFKPRDIVRETEVLYKFLVDGLDEEDIALLKISYDRLMQEESTYLDWLKDTQWVPHAPTFSAKPFLTRKRKHAGNKDDFSMPTTIHGSGCARTEGYYKQSPKIKRGFLATARQATAFEQLPSSLQVSEQTAKQQLQLSREARSNQRRLLNVMGDVESDIFKFNQLKFRKKCIRFSKSKIHGWGLFAMEPIGPDEMVVEYVGEKVRLMVAEKREKHYEKMGIGSSYLFRLDNDWAIDATKQGAVARFINHSCNPSCYAKIISLDGEKRIVIYSKQNITQGEEITYDYKFPIEDIKIPCNCGAHNCRGSLN